MRAQEGGPQDRADDQRDWEILQEWSPQEIEDWRANEAGRRGPEDEAGRE